LPELICDTSALIALQQVGLLHILQSLSPSVIVPAAVEQELAMGRASGHTMLDVASVNWLTVRAPISRPALPNAKLLGPGESDVLWIALETPASVAVLDEAPARSVANQLGIAFTGTLGLLLDAKHAGQIPAIKPVLDELQRHGFHMSPQIRDTILRTAGESP